MDRAGEPTTGLSLASTGLSEPFRARRRSPGFRQRLSSRFYGAFGAVPRMPPTRRHTIFATVSLLRGFRSRSESSPATSPHYGRRGLASTGLSEPFRAGGRVHGCPRIGGLASTGLSEPFRGPYLEVQARRVVKSRFASGTASAVSAEQPPRPSRSHASSVTGRASGCAERRISGPLAHGLRNNSPIRISGSPVEAQVLPKRLELRRETSPIACSPYRRTPRTLRRAAVRRQEE